jgi:hypothetical protein
MVGILGSRVRDYPRMATSRTLSPAERHWLQVLSTLNEYQARLSVGEKALELGRGRISRLIRLRAWPGQRLRGAWRNSHASAAAAGRDWATPAPRGRPATGRDARPALLRQLRPLLEETTAGDPMNAPSGRHGRRARWRPS